MSYLQSRLLSTLPYYRKITITDFGTNGTQSDQETVSAADIVTPDGTSFGTVQGQGLGMPGVTAQMNQIARGEQVAFTSSSGDSIVVSNPFAGTDFPGQFQQAVFGISDGSSTSFDNSNTALNLQTGQTGGISTSIVADSQTGYTVGTAGSKTTTTDGVTTTAFYNASGKETGDTWTNTNGTHGYDTWNTDGSSDSTSYKADGSYTEWTNDGQGDTTTQGYDANGNLTAEWWRNADGSYSTETNDDQNDISTNYYNAAGVKTTDNWSKPGSKHSGVTSCIATSRREY